MRSAPDPLGWAGYPEQLARARKNTGHAESVTYGRRRFGETDAMVIEFDFRFLGGSVGGGTGDVLEQAFLEAGDLPVVSLIATGGSRMQEGMVSLRQLQRIAALCARQRGPRVSVLRDPTTGGLWASLGASADVVLAVPGAQVGFAGSRVRPEDGPEYTAEGQFAAGTVDAVVPQGELEDRLTALLALLTGSSSQPAEVPRALGDLTLPDSGWTAVTNARKPERPRAKAYLDDHFETRFPLGRNAGVLCGLGRRGGRTIAYAAQDGTATTPAGFRAAARLIRLAERRNLPVLTFVDTPGAANDRAAEREGVGAAIAELFTTVAAARVPITTLVIGEGGSGGALALAAPDRTWISPNAYFSVIAPELAASILKRDDVPALADQLRLRPQDLVELGVVSGIAQPAALPLQAT
ncbi:acetyl-CoA carboxylase [Lentzea sp. NBRC 105346]|uniref:carboxyl transferase domain-containing protein n=1 Tax=Lentzea sp. NBRC 105346 TaxID=3032205 RepID=UPI002553EF74|nr:carboxyl transferase domain-containing protein [Lentzea sp. NBRC 105346]GLZ30463.1 acetyl-CoA carboxylase [Lentzea sp. NBRC 105346]